MFLLFLLLIVISCPVFAEYKPIPKELSKQYKKEMESIIDKGYPKAIKNINEYYDYVLKKRYVPEVSIYDTPLFIYADMMKTTQEKYLKSEYKPDGTDSISPASEFLYQYLKDNKVNIQKLKNINRYAELKDKQIQKLVF